MVFSLYQVFSVCGLLDRRKCSSWVGKANCIENWKEHRPKEILKSSHSEEEPCHVTWQCAVCYCNFVSAYVGKWYYTLLDQTFLYPVQSGLHSVFSLDIEIFLFVLFKRFIIFLFFPFFPSFPFPPLSFLPFLPSPSSLFSYPLFLPLLPALPFPPLHSLPSLSQGLSI